MALQDIDLTFQFGEDPPWEDEPYEKTCEYCHGTGEDPWNDGILPCPKCDGQGYNPR